MIIETDLPRDEFLEHFGVKGMKWGVRRARNKNDIERSRPKRSKAQTTTNVLRAAAFVLAGASLASSLMSRHGARKVASAKKAALAKNGLSFASQLLSSPISSAYAAGPIPMGPIRPSAVVRTASGAIPMGSIRR